MLLLVEGSPIDGDGSVAGAPLCEMTLCFINNDDVKGSVVLFSSRFRRIEAAASTSGMSASKSCIRLRLLLTAVILCSVGEEL